jgi:hypothetical protein
VLFTLTNPKETMMMKLNTQLTACAIAAAALLSACGGGGTTPGGGASTGASGETGTCTAAPCYNFSEANLGLVDFGGLAIEVVNDPNLSTNKVVKLTKEASDPTWAGVTIHFGTTDFSVPRIDPTQSITLRVYSPAAGRPIMVKIESASNDQIFKESTVMSTKANEWETLTFTFAGADAAAVYNKISVFPGFDTQVAGVYYIDELKYSTKENEVVPPAPALTFSSGFTSNVLTSSGGAIASAGGSDLDSWACSGGDAWCGSGAGGAGADSYMYYYYQTPSTAAGLYSQIELFGPNVTGLSTSADTGGVTLGSQTKVNFTFNPNPEWFNSSSPKLGVVLTLGKRYAIDNGCHIELHGVKPITSLAATAYSMNLRDEFRVASNCGTNIAPDDVAGALAASAVVSSVKFLGAGGGAAITGRNTVSSTANLAVVDANGKYPTTVALKGAITFD